MSEQPLLHSSVRRKLSRLKMALHGRLLGEGVSWILLALGAMVLATFALDYLLRLDDVLLRVVIMVAAWAGILYVAWRHLLAPMLVPMSTDSLALLVERRYGQLSDRLISALQFSARKDHGALTSQAMIDRVGQEANAMAATLDFSTVVEKSRLRRVLMAAILLTALVGSLATWQSQLFSIWFQRNILFASGIYYPQRTYLNVEGGPDFRVHRGEDLEVLVRVDASSSHQPQTITLYRKYGDIVASESISFDADVGAYVLRFPTVSNEFDFWVTGGDDRRDRQSPHQVQILETAELTSLQFTLRFHPYQNAEKSTRSFDATTDLLPAPIGSSILITGSSSLPLKAAQLHLNGWPMDVVDFDAVAAEATDPSRPVDRTQINLVCREVGTFNLPPYEHVAGDLLAMPGGLGILGAIEHIVRSPVQAATASARGYGDRMELTISLTDQENYTRVAARYPVRIEADGVPVFDRLEPQEVGTTITRDVMLPLLMQVKDDYGLGDIRVMVSVNNGEFVQFGDTIVVPRKPAREFSERHVVDLGMLNPKLKEGDAIRIQAQATDMLPAGFGGPNIGYSPIRNFTVVSAQSLELELIKRMMETVGIFQDAIQNQGLAHAKTLAANAAVKAENTISQATRDKLQDSAAIQKSVGTDVENFTDKLAGILAEMKANKIGSPEQIELMERGVLAPLREDLPQDIATVHDSLRASEKTDDPRQMVEQTDNIEKAQDGIKNRLERIAEQAFKFADRQQLAAEILDIRNRLEAEKIALEKLRKEKAAQALD